MIPIQTLLSFHQCGQSDFQLDNYVTVRNGGTPFGCLMQSLRELWKRWRGVRDDYTNLAKLRIDIDELREQSTDETFSGRRAAEDLKQKIGYIAEMEHRLADSERELVTIYAQASTYWQHLGFDKNPPTQEQLQLLDAERWEHHLRCSIALDFMCNGGLQRGTATLIQCLPKEKREAIFNDCLAVHEEKASQQRVRLQHVAWYMNYSPELPEPLALTVEECRSLIECCELSPLPKLLASSSPMDAITSPASNMLNACGSVKPVRTGAV